MLNSFHKVTQKPIWQDMWINKDVQIIKVNTLFEYYIETDSLGGRVGLFLCL